jgi:hypothetical protein
LPPPLVSLAKIELTINCDETGRRCLSGRPADKYPRKRHQKDKNLLTFKNIFMIATLIDNELLVL